MRRLKNVAVLWLVLAATTAAAQDASSSDRALARELVDAVGVTKIAGQRLHDLVPQILAAIKRANPTITEDALDELRRIGEQEMAAALPEFADAAAAIYAGIFSDDELRQLIVFYQSPVGRKATDKLPEIERQSAAFGSVWGRRIGERIGDRIRATALKKGYVI